MAQVREYINLNTETLVPVFVGISAVLLVITLALLWNYWRLHKGMRAYRQILERFGDRDIEEELSRLLTQVSSLDKRMSVEEHHGELQDSQIAQLQHHVHTVVQQVGLVRYNAFPDVAGDQSYSLALLNQDGDGVVLTTLHGRAEARTYCKLIVKGGSSYPLLPEEQRSIFQALQDGKSKRGTSAADRGANDDRRAYLLGRREDTADYQSSHPHPERPVPAPVNPPENAASSQVVHQGEDSSASQNEMPVQQTPTPSQCSSVVIGSAHESVHMFSEGVTVLSEQDKGDVHGDAELSDAMPSMEVLVPIQQQVGPQTIPSAPPPWHGSGVTRVESLASTLCMPLGSTATDQQGHVFDGTEVFLDDEDAAAGRADDSQHPSNDPKKGL